MKPQRIQVPVTKGIVIRSARFYDLANRLNFLGREAQFREATVELASMTPGQSILDVGCGTGNLTMTAKRRTGAGGEVHGIDAAPEMIELAQHKATEQHVDVHYQVGLIEKIPFPDKTFDVVLSSLMLHHLPKSLKRDAIAEIARVLKPRARFVAVDVDPILIGNLRSVEEAMRGNGFTEIQRGPTTFRTTFIRIHHLSGRAPTS